MFNIAVDRAAYYNVPVGPVAGALDQARRPAMVITTRRRANQRTIGDAATQDAHLEMAPPKYG